MIGKRIKILLLIKNETHKAFAKRIKISPVKLSRIITGKTKRPSVYDVKAIADGLNIKVDELFEKENIKQNKRG